MTDILLGLVWALVKAVGLVFVIILPMVSYTVYAERRVSAMIQDRLGPNRVGPMGLLQPIADAVKLLLKEDFTPASVNKFYYWLAPACAMAPSLMALAVIPFGSNLFGLPMVVANVDVGVLWVFAVSSLGVYGIVLAGWSSNSKYPFLGGIRSSSQMISYELSLGLSVIPIFLICGTLNLPNIVKYQIENGWLISPIWLKGISLTGINFPLLVSSIFSVDALVKILLWVPLFISFVVFMVSMFAETNRLPFDLPESETELVGGYHTEYSSMKFALFFLGEYAAMITGSAVIVTLFFGAWHVPFLPNDPSQFPWLGDLVLGIIHIAAFFIKVAILLFFFIWVRWTLPRFRYDQLMRLGWYFFFEIALANILLVAIILAFAPK
ncbi:MAG: NADH-quinone oxidoreductase subunit H [Verrucomicrobia bacterium]|nr:NADH-quinone oxidoreductase subunit H [Verrucomicrobiota bacterium]MBV8482501.1 NADH-quinone oxidoreductase subunit H [Verrucomicrobiota bacterium]